MNNKYGIRVDWSTFKALLDEGVPFQEQPLPGSVRLLINDGGTRYQTVIHTDGNMPTEWSEYQSGYQANKNGQVVDRDGSGRQINRSAATKKGWHYQSHAIEFELGNKTSLHNKDDEGNDLGMASLKFFNDAGTDITDQDQAYIDSNAVKTVMHWKPNYDFEIISGNIRQISKKNSDIYMYVNMYANVGTLEAPFYVKVKFTEGGINLNYIGADELLQTDGRASKFVKGSNGDYLETTIMHPNLDKHRITLILEIFKDPLS